MERSTLIALLVMLISTFIVSGMFGSSNPFTHLAEWNKSQLYAYKNLKIKLMEFRLGYKYHT